METHPDPKPSHPAEASKPKLKSYADAARQAPASSAIPRKAVNASIARKGNNVTPAATSSTASLQKGTPRRFGDSVAKDPKPSHPAEASKPKPKSYADAVRQAPASSAIPRNAVNASIARKGNNVTPAATFSTASLQKGWFGDQAISVAKEQEQELANAFATVEVSSESDKCDPQQPLQIGQNLELLPDKKLSDGKNQDNNILWGTYKVPTAVKRLHKADYDMNAEKIQILIKDSKKHPNSVTYFGVTSDEEGSYVAMEQEYYLDETSFNLDELVQLDLANSNPSDFVANDRLKVVNNIVGKFELIPKNGCPIPDLLWTLARKVLCGLGHLHDTLGISHGDLKPQNIRIIKKGSLWYVKLSDMGFKTGSGTLDRQACRDHGNHIWVDDMHTFGRIFFYCLTGNYEFDDWETITKKSTLLEDYPEARHLFLCLTSKNPTERLTAKDALRHPHFWDLKVKLLFLLDTYKRVFDFGGKDLRNELETISSKVIVGKWKGEHVEEWNYRIHANIMNYAIDQLKKYSPNNTYKYKSLPELLRFIRNYYIHYGKCPPNIQKSLGSLEEGFYNYFESRFPNLLIEVYTGVEKWCGKENVAPDCWLRGARTVANRWIAVSCHSKGSTALQKSAPGCSSHNGSV